ncbi:hypothetical protein [Stenotrophomonas rhizophila]|uniref:hypothetical protein n=1 Tax=Stenotrophomonas rhizophila TaxID=216778 RepID=UPI00112F368A|nr:hypothetical protein [Stenotrophomonas rhizophila]
MTQLPAQAPTVASTVRDIVRTGAAGEKAPAATLTTWGQTFMSQLYGPQTAVRYECRPRYTTEPWLEALPSDVLQARKRGLEVRALYLHPKAQPPTKKHRLREGVCVDCHEAEWLAGPECTPPPPSRDQRAALPFDPFWFREPLQALQQIAATKVINHYDCLKWDRECTYLIERLDQYLKDTQA